MKDKHFKLKEISMKASRKIRKLKSRWTGFHQQIVETFMSDSQSKTNIFLSFSSLCYGYNMIIPFNNYLLISELSSKDYRIFLKGMLILGNYLKD